MVDNLEYLGAGDLCIDAAGSIVGAVAAFVVAVVVAVEGTSFGLDPVEWIPFVGFHNLLRSVPDPQNFVAVLGRLVDYCTAVVVFCYSHCEYYLWCLVHPVDFLSGCHLLHL